MIGTEIGTIASLWRYPVKSMLGERCDALTLDRRGVVGDRLFAVCDEEGKFGSGKTSRRFRRMEGLFEFHARYDGETPLVTFPDGATLSGDNPDIHKRLSAVLGIPVRLGREAEISHFDDGPLHLVTTASLRALGALMAQAGIDERRFRPNIVIETGGDGFLEDRWLGREIVVGEEARLRVTGQTERCVMVNFAQDELVEEPRTLSTLARTHDACMGVYAAVIATGTLRIGDHVQFASGE